MTSVGIVFLLSGMTSRGEFV